MAYSAEFLFLLLVLHVSGGNDDATSYAAVYKCFKRPNLLYYRGFQRSTSTSHSTAKSKSRRKKWPEVWYSLAARVCRNLITHGGGADGRTICCSTGLPGYIKYLWRKSSFDLNRQSLKNSTCTNLLSAFHGNITMQGRLDQLQASDRKQDIRYPSDMFLYRE